MPLTELLVPTYRQMLRTLDGVLDKTSRPLPEQAEALMSMRLAPDMYPLSSQVRFAAFQAQEAVFRLRGEVVPAWLDGIAREGRNANEAPGSLAQARARIAQALSFLDDLATDALDAGAGLPVTIELPGGLPSI